MNRFSGSPTSALQVRIAELKRQGKNIVSLSIGEPDFDTPNYVKEGAIQAIQEGFTKYTPVNGIFELREAIANKLRKENGMPVTPDNICVSVGAKQGVYSSLMVLCDKGDEVIIPVPCWVSYTEMVKLSEATPILVPLQGRFQPGFGCDPRGRYREDEGSDHLHPQQSERCRLLRREPEGADGSGHREGFLCSGGRDL